MSPEAKSVKAMRQPPCSLGALVLESRRRRVRSPRPCWGAHTGPLWLTLPAGPTLHTDSSGPDITEQGGHSPTVPGPDS